LNTVGSLNELSVYRFYASGPLPYLKWVNKAKALVNRQKTVTQLSLGQFVEYPRRRTHGSGTCISHIIGGPAGMYKRGSQLARQMGRYPVHRTSMLPMELPGNNRVDRSTPREFAAMFVPQQSPLYPKRLFDRLIVG
jgi:hypothetical protein